MFTLLTTFDSQIRLIFRIILTVWLIDSLVFENNSISFIFDNSSFKSGIKGTDTLNLILKSRYYSIENNTKDDNGLY